MKTLSVTEVSSKFSAVSDSVERRQAEIVLVDALEVFRDLYQTIDDHTAEASSAAVSSVRKRRRGRVSELTNPWAG
jgi:hypothetical protein